MALLKSQIDVAILKCSRRVVNNASAMGVGYNRLLFKVSAMQDPFDFAPKVPKFTVIGNPIAHSKSPQIHQMFARQFSMHIEYNTTLGESGGFNQAAQHFKASGGQGLNVTVPFKLDAFALCDQLSQRAELAGAVNTLWFSDDGKIQGDNTDGIGMLRDITQNIGFDVAGKNVLVIGAGGAVRGVLEPLLEAMPASLTVANRTEGKAIELAELFEGVGTIISSSLKALEGSQFDLVINGTAASLSGELPEIPKGLCKNQALAYDMMYAAQPTIFMKWALADGAAQASDGLGMLVEQAAEAFSIWNKQFPDTKPVIEALRQGSS
ncbi:MAG: shikimate dehydrogenase [Gammaproteobacteria bacterium]